MREGAGYYQEEAENGSGSKKKKKGSSEIEKGTSESDSVEFIGWICSSNKQKQTL